MNTATENRFADFVGQSQTAVPLPWYTVTVTSKAGNGFISFETTLRAKTACSAITTALFHVPMEVQNDVRGVQVSEPRDRQ